MPAQITLPIVGVDYPNKRGPTRRFAVEMLQPGDPVVLRTEPENPADENAVAVFSVDDIQIGYIPAQRAPYVGMQMRRGAEVRAVYQGRAWRRDFVRISFDGEDPVLPTAPDASDEPADWYPDEIYSDD